MMTHDEISHFFSEEDVKKAFQLPDWPAGTEIVCYCRSTDNRDTIEQIAQQRRWKIVKYVHIDELPIAKFYKPGQVMFAKREAWEREQREEEEREAAMQEAYDHRDDLTWLVSRIESLGWEVTLKKKTTD